MSKFLKSVKDISKSKKICIVVVLVGVLLVSTYMLFQKDKSTPSDEYEKFYDIDAKEYQEFLKEDGRSINTGVFTITLESYIYDKDTKAGFCKFAIRQNDGGTNLLEHALDWSGTGVNLGEYGYEISPQMSGSVGARRKLKDDTLYNYVRFYVGTYVAGCEDKIYVDDATTDTLSDYCFDLEETIGTKGKSYSDDYIKIDLSPLALSIESNDTIQNVSLIGDKKKILLEDGVITEGVGSSRYSGSGYQGIILRFINPYDIEQVQKVNINGKEYKFE